MAKGRVSLEYRELVKLFESLTGSKNMWEVFNDCIEIFALTIQNRFESNNKSKKMNERCKEISKKYTENERKTISIIFAEIVKMVEINPFRDLLGNLYMQLEMGSRAAGQFFTPYAAAEVMGECVINLEEINEEIREKGYITVSEPSVGGGANIIAFCEYLNKNNIDYQNKCVFVCQDLSRLTVLMCYIILSLMGCAAVIKVGDSLTEKFSNYNNEVEIGSELWTTPMFHVCNCYNKC